MYRAKLRVWILLGGSAVISYFPAAGTIEGRRSRDQRLESRVSGLGCGGTKFLILVLEALFTEPYIPVLFFFNSCAMYL